ncbi:LuxR C-terminal-related transcriptional regulator [Streptomyces luteogriseus]|uniref:LuxR C-terminal-related transcriptional regulator n=1 Tax=Streptomyces luteogriseus TaxID=68233 RepID=UPI0037AAA3E6
MPETDTDSRVRVESARHPLTEEDERVYWRLAAREHARPDDEPHLERLAAHHLIEPDPHSPQTPLTLDPRLAERQKLDEVTERIMSELVDLRRAAKSYERLEDAYTQQQWSEGGVRLLDTPELANASIGRAMSRLTSNLYTAQPTQRSAKILEASRERDGKLLQQGINMFTIYPQSARIRDPETQWAEEMSALGAEIRTSPLPFPRIILIDGVAAFLEEPPKDGTAPNATGPAIEVTHPSLVTWVRSIFMFWWQMSQPWRGERLREARTEDTLTTPRERVILRLLEDEQPRSKIARDLDVSQRTISNELQSLRAKFGVDTDFALAMRWREHSEYNIP